MKAVLFAVAALTATSTAAADLGMGLALNTEVKAYHKVDAETNHLTVEPELRWTSAAGPLSVYGEMPITMYETNHTSGDDWNVVNILDDGNYPLLELGAEYDINGNTMAYAETTYDFNAEDRGEIEVGVAWTF